VALVDLGIGDTSDFVAGLARTQSTLVVPGRFFGAPDRVRVALGTESRVLDRGLERIAAALVGRRGK
jgi:aspartate/methionine/tyrosine aminotransferase